MAEFFMIRPHGPNCWIGLGAFNDRVLLQNIKEVNEVDNRYSSPIQIGQFHGPVKRIRKERVCHSLVQSEREISLFGSSSDTC